MPKKLPSLEVKVLAGAFVGEAAKLEKQQLKLEPDVKYRIKVKFIAKDGTHKEVIKNLYGADLAFVDDGIHRTYTNLETFYDIFFPLLDVGLQFAVYTTLGGNTFESTYFSFAAIGVVVEIFRIATMICYIDWKLEGNTSMADYPIVGHVLCNLCHAFFCDVPICAMYTIMAVDDGGGMPVINIVSMMVLILNTMRAFIHMGKMKDVSFGLLCVPIMNKDTNIPSDDRTHPRQLYQLRLAFVLISSTVYTVCMDHNCFSFPLLLLCLC
jgi:hypothetical protein